MNKLFSVLIAGLSIVSLAQSARAESVNIPGSAGVPDNDGYCAVQLDSGQTFSQYGPTCQVMYPVSLPVGKTIDTVELDYYFGGGVADAAVTGYLESRQVKPLGSVAQLGSWFAYPKNAGEGYFHFPFFTYNIPVTPSTSYWVRVEAFHGISINNVTINYH